MNKVCVLVAGSWGTALASVLADNEHKVYLWTRNSEQAADLNASHENKSFLPGIKLSNHIHATSSMEEAVTDSMIVLLAAPSSAMRSIASQIKPYLHPDAILIHASKGFELESLKRMTTVISEELPEYDARRIVVLSGPSHAEEVIHKSPTTVVVASEDITAAEAAQDALINTYFRVYTNPDVTGVEVGGALKNIIAIGAGLSDGLEFGDNAKAALITRGLAEISRLGVAMGANPLTFAGLAGIGDLVVTCTSRHSRNWRAGYKIAQGIPMDEVQAKMGMVVEGIKTTRTAYELSRQHQIEMPITNALNQVMFEGKIPKDAVVDLMGRGKTRELEELSLNSHIKWLE